MKHIVSTRFAVALASLLVASGALIGAGVSLAVSAPPQVMLTERAPDLSDVWVLPQPGPGFDLTNDWERCLAAMESAEIPGWMWECHELAQAATGDMPSEPAERCEWLLSWPDRIQGGEAYPYRREVCPLAFQPVS